MTLVVNESQRAENQNTFSTELLANAACLDLTQLGPVGDWNYGQGIRKAKDNHFFYELRAQYFFPLGINHPISLKSKWLQFDFLLTIQSFPSHFCESFPILREWNWCIRPRTTTTNPHWFRENSTLKDPLGWDGFNRLKDIDGWIVDLNEEYEWVASSSSLGPSGPSQQAFSFQEQIKVFLSEDVFGNQGRLKEWIQKLSIYTWGKWEGLNFSFKTHASVEDLNNAGIAADIINGELRAHFCLSMLPEDVENIMRVLRPYQG